MIESAIFRNNKGRFIFIPIPLVCERCAWREDRDPHDVFPRYSHSAGRVMTLCNACTH